jgi:hypothetical protein
MNRILFLLACILSFGVIFLLRKSITSKKTTILRIPTKKTAPESEEEQIPHIEIIPEGEESKPYTKEASKEEYPLFIHSDKQNLKIEPSWDKIVLEFKDEDPGHSFEPRNQIGDYTYKNQAFYQSPENAKYFLIRKTWRYENHHGNKIEVINNVTRREGKDTSTFKIQVHSETRFIQLNEVEAIGNIISTQYKNHIRREIQLYPIVAELALDHFTSYPYFYYNLNQGHLFKRHYKNRIEYDKGLPDEDDELDESETSTPHRKPIWTKMRKGKKYILKDESATYYLGGKASQIYARCYLMFPMGGGEPIYRLEATFNKPFFKKQGLKTVGELSCINFHDAWKENFRFVLLKWDDILQSTVNLPTQGVIKGLQEYITPTCHDVYDISFPRELDAYDIIKMIPKIKTDWEAIYDSLPDNLKQEFDRLWKTPIKFSKEKKIPRTREPQEVYQELKKHLEKQTGNPDEIENYIETPHKQIMERLFDNAEKKLLTDYPECHSYNEMILSSIMELMRSTTPEYRIKKAIEKVKGTQDEDNKTAIARLAHTTKPEVYKYLKSVSD